MTAGQQRVLFTKWIEQAWKETAANEKMVVQAFKKCVISVAINESENAEINIAGLDNYCINTNKELNDDSFDNLD